MGTVGRCREAAEGRSSGTQTLLSLSQTGCSLVPGCLYPGDPLEVGEVRQALGCTNEAPTSFPARYLAQNATKCMSLPVQMCLAHLPFQSPSGAPFLAANTGGCFDNIAPRAALPRCSEQPSSPPTTSQHQTHPVSASSPLAFRGKLHAGSAHPPGGQGVPASHPEECACGGDYNCSQSRDP